MVDAVVDVGAAVLPFEAWGAVAGVVGEVVPADTSVLAGLELARAKVDLVLAELAGVAARARADVAVDAVDAGGVVLAPVALAVVNIHLTPAPQRTRCTFTKFYNQKWINFDLLLFHGFHEIFASDRKHISPDTGISFGALAGEPPGFHDLAGGAVGARVAVAGVDDGVAVLAVEAGGAGALVVAVGQRPACRSVAAGVVVTQITLGQDLRLNLTCKGLVTWLNTI